MTTIKIIEKGVSYGGISWGSRSGDNQYPVYYF